MARNYKRDARGRFARAASAVAGKKTRRRAATVAYIGLVGALAYQNRPKKNARNAWNPSGEPYFGAYTSRMKRRMRE